MPDFDIPFFPPDLYKKLAQEIIKGDPAAQIAIKAAEAALKAKVDQRVAAQLAAKQPATGKIPGWAILLALAALAAK